MPHLGCFLRPLTRLEPGETLPKSPFFIFFLIAKCKFSCTISEIAYVRSRFRSPGRIFININSESPDIARIYHNTGHHVLGRRGCDQKYVFFEPTEPSTMKPDFQVPLNRPSVVPMALDRRPWPHKARKSPQGACRGACRPRRSKELL